MLPANTAKKKFTHQEPKKYWSEYTACVRCSTTVVLKCNVLRQVQEQKDSAADSLASAKEYCRRGNTKLRESSVLSNDEC